MSRHSQRDDYALLNRAEPDSAIMATGGLIGAQDIDNMQQEDLPLWECLLKTNWPNTFPHNLDEGLDQIARYRDLRRKKAAFVADVRRLHQHGLGPNHDTSNRWPINVTTRFILTLVAICSPLHRFMPHSN